MVEENPMEQPVEQPIEQSMDQAIEQPPVPTEAPAGPIEMPPAEMPTLSYIYALGKVEIRFPNLSVEKEIAQALGREDTAGLTDQQALHALLSQRHNRYLVRQLCWVLTIEGMETYILQPRPADFDMLVEAVRPRPAPGDIDIIIGILGPIASPEMCNGLLVPLVAVDQIYSFDRDSFIKSIPRPETIPDEQEAQFRATAEELLDRIMQLADNAGAMDEHRAVNYLAARYPAIYATASQAYAEDRSLTGVEVRTSRLSGVSRIVDVIFSYTHRQTDVTEKYFVRVDVTQEFPFLVTKMQPFYER